MRKTKKYSNFYGQSFVFVTYSAILKSDGFTRDTMYVTIGMNLLNGAGHFWSVWLPSIKCDGCCPFNIIYSVHRIHDHDLYVSPPNGVSLFSEMNVSYSADTFETTDKNRNFLLLESNFLITAPK